MFELDIDLIKEQGLQLVDTAKKTARELAGKGKSQLDLVSQQARLSKAQRQLGALVYSLHKAGEENQPLVDKYIEAVAEVEKAIEDLKAQMTPAEVEEAEAETEAADEAPVEETEAPEAEPAEEPEAEETIEEEPVAPRGETKTCPVCQAQIDADALFCTHCGAQL